MIPACPCVAAKTAGEKNTGRKTVESSRGMMTMNHVKLFGCSRSTSLKVREKLGLGSEVAWDTMSPLRVLFADFAASRSHSPPDQRECMFHQHQPLTKRPQCGPSKSLPALGARGGEGRTPKQ